VAHISLLIITASAREKTFRRYLKDKSKKVKLIKHYVMKVYEGMDV
jgi:hypothetical protein